MPSAKASSSQIKVWEKPPREWQKYDLCLVMPVHARTGAIPPESVEVIRQLAKLIGRKYLYVFYADSGGHIYVLLRPGLKALRAKAAAEKWELLLDDDSVHLLAQPKGVSSPSSSARHRSPAHTHAHKFTHTHTDEDSLHTSLALEHFFSPSISRLSPFEHVYLPYSDDPQVEKLFRRPQLSAKHPFYKTLRLKMLLDMLAQSSSPSVAAEQSVRLGDLVFVDDALYTHPVGSPAHHLPLPLFFSPRTHTHSPTREQQQQQQRERAQREHRARVQAREHERDRRREILSLPHLLHRGAVLNAFAIHELFERDEIARKACAFVPVLLPLNAMQRYFGEKITFYFAFLDYANQGLYPLALIGVVLQSFSLYYDDHSRSEIFAFALFLSFSLSLTLQGWQREQRLLALRWNTLRSDLRERILSLRNARPNFYGQQIKSYVDGTAALHFPALRRALLYLFSFALLVMCVCATLCVCLCVLYGRQRLLSLSLTAPHIAWLTAAMAAAQTQLCSRIFSVIATQLTELENHRFDRDFELALIVKTAIFEAVNSLALALYFAFAAPYLQTRRVSLRFVEISLPVGERLYNLSLIVLAVTCAEILTRAVSLSLLRRVSLSLWRCVTGERELHSDEREREKMREEAMMPELSLSHAAAHTKSDVFSGENPLSRTRSRPNVNANSSGKVNNTSTNTNTNNNTATNPRNHAHTSTNTQTNTQSQKNTQTQTHTNTHTRTHNYSPSPTRTPSHYTQTSSHTPTQTPTQSPTRAQNHTRSATQTQTEEDFWARERERDLLSGGESGRERDTQTPSQTRSRTHSHTPTQRERERGRERTPSLSTLSPSLAPSRVSAREARSGKRAPQIQRPPSVRDRASERHRERGRRESERGSARDNASVMTTSVLGADIDVEFTERDTFREREEPMASSKRHRDRDRESATPRDTVRDTSSAAWSDVEAGRVRKHRDRERDGQESERATFLRSVSVSLNTVEPDQYEREEEDQADDAEAEIGVEAEEVGEREESSLRERETPLRDPFLAHYSLRYDTQKELFASYTHQLRLLLVAACFGAMLPGVFALLLVDHYLEVRGHCWALCFYFPRPLPETAENIGVWLYVLQAVFALGSLVNSALVVFTLRQVAHWDSTLRLALGIGCAAALLLCQYLLGLYFAQMPAEVVVQKQRTMFIAAKISPHRDLPIGESEIAVEML